MKISSLNHIAIIVSNYNVSKKFYVDVLGLEVLDETYRSERNSYLLRLGLNGQYMIELFTFVNSPQRITNPEALGLRHLAFNVKDLNVIVSELKQMSIVIEPIRVDPLTGKRFTFIKDPDGLPIELVEV